MSKPQVRVLQEIRQMKFPTVYSNWTEKKLSIEQAATILGVCERTFRRQVKRYEEEGAQGLVDKRLDKVSHNAAPVDEVMEVIALFETHYSNFNVSHFYEKYQDEYKGQRSYTWVKNCLQDANLVTKAKKRGAHRRKRPRQPMPGMMLHQDASTHEWVPGEKWDLVVTMDDANNEIYSAFFVEEEGTWSSFQGVREVIEEHGLFCSLYTDRGTHYWSTPKVGGKVDKVNLTQFGRAMQKLDIKMIPSYSPEARGRSERMFGTLQGRLPQELALAGINNMQEANRFIREKFLPKFNERFMVSPEETQDAFAPWLLPQFSLDEILCLQEERTVRKDNTIVYKNKLLQLPKDKYRYHYVKSKIEIHEYATGEVSVFYGHRCLAKYNADGNLKETNTVKSESKPAAKEAA